MPPLRDPGQWQAGSGVSHDGLGAEANAGTDHSDAEKTDDDFKE